MHHEFCTNCIYNYNNDNNNNIKEQNKRRKPNTYYKNFKGDEQKQKSS